MYKRQAWESKQVGEGTKLKIKVSKKQNKTYYDEMLVLDDEGQEEETEERVGEEKSEKEAKKVTQAKPKLKG